MINGSMEEGFFRNILKISKIIPIYKMVIRKISGRYQSSVRLKNFLKYGALSVTSFLDNNQIFKNNQCGFRKCLSIADLLYNSLDSRHTQDSCE